METNNNMPAKYWFYVWGLLVAVFLLLTVTFAPVDPGMPILMSTVYAAFVTLWLAIVHFVWFSEGILYKILAVIFGGLFAVVAVVIIQFVYEKLVFERKGSLSDY